jgi:protein-S-isoprenylcysteine O-methyltransferase Ste14
MNSPVSLVAAEAAMKDPAGLMLALTVNAYWATVLLLAVVRGVRLGQGVGLLPAKLNERLLWIVWVPVICAWNVLPLVALNNHRPPWGWPEHLRVEPVVADLRMAAAACGLACYLLTLRCWLRMGNSWSLAIVPGRSAALVRSDLFGLVRHPIYSLSMVLMLASVVVVATEPFVILTVIHLTVLNLKARNEEKYLLETHGQSYREYALRTGRFLPRVASAAGRSI